MTELVVGVRFTYEAQRAMAEAIHQADKGTNLDASPTWVRDRYMVLAEAALHHAADAAEVVIMEPVHAGWNDGTIAVGADPYGPPPDGFEDLYRVISKPGPG